MVERSLSMREVPGSIPGASNKFCSCSNQPRLDVGKQSCLSFVYIYLPTYSDVPSTVVVLNVSN